MKYIHKWNEATSSLIPLPIPHNPLNLAHIRTFCLNAIIYAFGATLIALCHMTYIMLIYLDKVDLSLANRVLNVHIAI
jgi:hypothetical protein